MATPSHAQAVKSLNKSHGRRRFVFQSVSQRIAEIDINVYRSLDKIKSEPSEGSTFIRDCLIEWRELNTAEDFISFYGEAMPLVQSLPLVLLHKELIFNKLKSRLHMKARLSIEPILRLLAAFSRDLLEDFIPFLPDIAESLVSLLKSGADREPEIIEQIFTSWSCIMMYLQKHLTRNVKYVIEITVNLRYYPKDYVQEFMAKATSFLLRNAPAEQLEEGIRKTLFEVVKEPLPIRKSGVSALLCYIMLGTSSRFHSRAGDVLQLLVANSIFAICDKCGEGSDAILEVVTTAFQKISKELEPKELTLMWKCLYKEISASEANGSISHLSRLLSILSSVVEVNSGRAVADYQEMFEVVKSLMQKNVLLEIEVVEKVLQLMPQILDGLHDSNYLSSISGCLLQWNPVFKLGNSCLLDFLEKLLLKDPSVIYIFREYIISAMNDLIESSEVESSEDKCARQKESQQHKILCLLLSFFERLQTHPQSSDLLDRVSEGRLSNIRDYMQGVIRHWIRLVNDLVQGNSLPSKVDEAGLAMLWGTISCYPHIFDAHSNESVLMNLINALDQLLMIEAENVAGVSKHTWESLVGAALGSLNKLYSAKKPVFEEMSKVLNFAKAWKSSSQVLFAVADYLDNVNGPALEVDSSKKIYHPMLKGENTMNAIGIFADNLCHPDKGIRLATLRILCHYEPLSYEIPTDDQPAKKKMRTEVSQACSVDSNEINVLQLLLSVEATPLSISTSRKVTLLISKIQMSLSAGKIPETYVPLALNGIIGIFHNRFSYLWDAASECLAFLISKHTKLVWDKFIQCFEQCQSMVQVSDRVNANSSEDKPSDLVGLFNLFVNPFSDNTPSLSVVSLLLQALQKIPSVAESRSRQIIPLFLRFLGYDSSNLGSVGSFNSKICHGKEWKGVLKEWLNLLKLMRNPISFYRSQFLKDVLQYRLLDETDADIQARVVDCLLLWKDDFLVPYDQHLKNLINSKSLREELTTWSLSRESGQIEEGHRNNLVPLVVRLLIPKIRKLKTLASQKNARVQLRKAVLGFICQLDAHELPLFFALLLKPLQIISNEDYGASILYQNLPNTSIDEFDALNHLKYFTVENITALSLKKRYGFLHVIEDVISVFDEFHLRPFLDLLMACVVRVLATNRPGGEPISDDKDSLVASCHSSIDGADHPDIKPISDDEDSSGANQKQTDKVIIKSEGSLCLKIISLALNKYGDHDFGCEFWDLFFTSVKPLIDNFKQGRLRPTKPSSLFSCFLAMSRSHRLVSLLCRERDIVSDIFSILSVSTASEAMVSCVLTLISNLLDIDCELDDGNSPIKSVIYLNLEALVCSLHLLFQGESTSKRKLVRCVGETDIRIFKLLSKYITDPLLAKKFVDILLPFLSKRVQGSGICLEAVQVIQEIIPVLRSERTSEILNAVAPLLISAKLDIRVFICDLLESLAETDASVLVVARHIRQLNATSNTSEHNGVAERKHRQAFELELDYDTIGKAYEEIGIGFFPDMPVDHTLLILSQCVYDMSSEDLILRHYAYRLLLTFVEFSAKVLSGEVADFHETPEDMMIDGKGCWTTASIQRIMNKFLLKHMGDAISRGISAKKEWIDLLRAMVIKLPQMANLNLFRHLCSEDADQDFFNNIIHLQKQRRAKALSRFTDVINKTNMSKDIINKVFVPLFFKMLFDLQHGKDEHVRTACIQALASVSAKMEWKSYYALLLRCFKEIKMKPDMQKVLLRLICSILDQFNYSNICSSGAKDSLGNSLGSEMNSNASSALDKCGNPIIVAEIQSSLQQTLLPKIQQLLSFDSDNVNVNISLVALKLLKLLPGDIMESQLSSIIRRISNFLKSRLESTRDEARSALAECLKELGLDYLQFIVSVLRSTLKRGFELHVLGYTLNFVLSKALSLSTCGSLDYCLEDLLSVVENDILGNVAEEKEVGKIASKMKETRKCKSFETLKLIAQSITFKTHASKLLSLVTTHLQKHLTPKVKAKLENMLKHIADGIECNPSVDQTDLFIFVYGLIAGAANEDNGLGAKTVSSSQVFCTKSACSHLITVFALGVLQNRIKSLKLDKHDGHLLSMLDPFIKLLGDCLSSKYEDVLCASLRCLTPLVRLPLPSLESQADKLKVTLLDIAQGSVNPGNPLMQSCLKLLTVLLGSTEITLSSDQLCLLVQFPMFVDLERNPSFVALSLLKAIINRKLVVPEIYNIAVQVANLMVTSQVEPIRKKCSKIFLQFLRNYHLSETRLLQHLGFLLANLKYEHPTGRESVLEMLNAIIIKFEIDIVDEQSRTIFFHLVECLANDQDNNVRSMTGAVIKLLLHRIKPHTRNAILTDSLSWYLAEKQQLWSVGAQVLGLLVEVEVKDMEKGFKKHISSILPMTKSILHSAIDAFTNTQRHLSDESTMPFWKEAYYSLVMLEKMLRFPKLISERDLEDIWEMVLDFLLHPHAWLRNISNRLIAQRFALVNKNKTRRESFDKSYGASFFMMPSRLFMIAISLCCQLKAPISDDEAVAKCVKIGTKEEKEKNHKSQSSLITENLVFAICGLNSLMRDLADVSCTKFWATLEHHEQERFLKAFRLLDSRKATGMLLSITSAKHEENDGDHSEGLQFLFVSSLLKELGKLALQMDAIQMRIVFNSFQKILPEISQEDSRRYAPLMMLPLYKVCEGFAGKIIADDLKQLAEEVLRSIRETLGTKDYGHVYGEIKKKLKSKRDKRKRDEKLMAVINPARNAKRKLRNAAKHRANKKRKIMAMKMERWMR